MYNLIKKMLFQFDPETAHDLVKNFSKFVPKSFYSASCKISSEVLTHKFCDISFENPIGLAAGFDKNGEMISFLESFGFGFLELGSITWHECQGNPKPRIFRLPQDQSLINRMGLPNWGAQKFSQHFSKQNSHIPIGLNIAKTPAIATQKKYTLSDGIEDYINTFQTLKDLGRYFTFNLSCPNTGDGKTFEDPQAFTNLAQEISNTKKSFNIKQPIFIKLSPSLDTKDLNQIVEIACKYEFDGFVLTNTSSLRNNLKTSLEKIKQIGNGGLSGKAITQNANDQLKKVFDIVKKQKVLIGVGGIMGFSDAIQRISSGASLLQVYTGFIYNGPLWIKKLNEELVSFCEKQGVKNYSELVGEKF